MSETESDVRRMRMLEFANADLAVRVAQLEDECAKWRADLNRVTQERDTLRVEIAAARGDSVQANYVDARDLDAIR